MSKLPLAIECANWAHWTQFDKGGQPYILHPLTVMMAVEGEAEKIAAVLHDSVEDSDLTLVEIEFKFGVEIADAVDALTKRKGEDYFDMIYRCKADKIARVVKLADLRHNMQLDRLPPDLTQKDHDRNDKYARAIRILSGAID